jgi:hypothetical protein
MHCTTLGIEVAKTVFQLHGVVACGHVVVHRICQNSPQKFTQPLWIEDSEVLWPQYFVSKSTIGARSGRKKVGRSSSPTLIMPDPRQDKLTPPKAD